jgi:geranylgeranylglycerol-phosphate geranylgeranyltransferase
MHRFLETLKLMRVVNCLLAMVGVGVGAYLTWWRPDYTAVFIAGAAAFLVCAAGNIVNDLVDVSIDSINHPQRVLVRNSLTKRYAVILTIVFNVVALLLAASVNRDVAVVALAVIILLLLYNLRFKRIPLLGNITIAVLSGLTFITGGLAVDRVMTFILPGPLIPAVFAFFFHLVREIVKDVEDMAGDRQAGIKTLPQIIGVRKALLTALVLFVVLVLLTYVPILAGWFGKYYKYITIFGIDLPLLALLILVWNYPTARMLRAGSVGLKAGMGLGIVALLAA